MRREKYIYLEKLISGCCMHIAVKISNVYNFERKNV